jgi:hypothetical protein
MALPGEWARKPFILSTFLKTGSPKKQEKFHGIPTNTPRNQGMEMPKPQNLLPMNHPG